MKRAQFFRLLDTPLEQKHLALSYLTGRLREGQDEDRLFHVPTHIFERYPTSAFVYDLPPEIAAFFTSGRPVPDLLFQACRGLGASNADHLFRAAWEVAPAEIGLNLTWTRFNNGGPYSPFYFPSVYVVRSDGGTWRSLLAYDTGAVTGRESYGRPGVGFGKRTNFMYGYPLPADHAFSVEGQALFPATGQDLPITLALVNSRVYAALANRFTAQHKYHGYLNTLWMHPLDTEGLGAMALSIVEHLRALDALNETSPQFWLPLPAEPSAGHEPFVAVARWAADIAQCANENRAVLDTEIERRLGVSVPLSDHPPYDVDYTEAFFGVASEAGPALWAANLVQWCLGCAFGRFNARLARNPSSVHHADVFGPLPPIAFGALTDDSDSHAYVVARDGILVDDEGHPRDIVAAVRRVLAFSFGEDRASELETEILKTLQGSGRAPSSLREWFRGQKSTVLSKSFFEFHIQRYSRSRRKSPIHWRLTAGNAAPYSVWVHYPALTRDSLWAVLADYVAPRQKLTETHLADARSRLGTAEGLHRRQTEEDVERNTALLDALQALETEIRRVVEHGYSPNLDDGVPITIAPLHRIVPWTEPAKTWRELESGEHDWSKLALAMWPERVREKCGSDHSVATAHGVA